MRTRACYSEDQEQATRAQQDCRTLKRTPRPIPAAAPFGNCLPVRRSATSRPSPTGRAPTASSNASIRRWLANGPYGLVYRSHCERAALARPLQAAQNRTAHSGADLRSAAFTTCVGRTAVTFAENDDAGRLIAAGEDCYGELGVGRSPRKPFDGSSEKPHSRQTYRVAPSSSTVMPIVTPQAGQIGGRSSSASAVFPSSTRSA